jgi:hypothetical protein
VAFDWLEINRLTASGELKRRVRCLARRITVFRSNTPSELETYALALQGKESTDRFSILLDSAAFTPLNHNLVGFGEKFLPTNTMSVELFLINSGAPADKVEPLLLSCGLGGLGKATVGQLSPSQARILRIVAATQDPKKVLVLREPFHEVPDAWRDKIADLLSDFAWKQHAIVIITNLSYRPQSWIENEVIARVQLERPRQATIGFGGQSHEAEAIKAIREEHQSGLRSGMILKPLPAKTKPQSVKLFPKTPPAVAISALAFFALLGAIWFGPVPSTVVSSREITIQPVEMQPQAGEGETPAAAQSLGGRPTVGLGRTSEASSVKRAALLDRFPENIRDAVLQAFDTPEESIKIWYRSVHLDGPPPRPIVPANPVRSYQASPAEVSYLHEEAMNEDEMEARREEIRRRFLEAIQAQG